MTPPPTGFEMLRQDPSSTARTWVGESSFVAPADGSLALDGIAPRTWEERASTLLRGLFPLILLLAVVPFGSVGPFALPIMTIAVALWSGCVLLLARSLRPLAAASLLLGVVAAVYVALQAAGADILLPSHPIWAEASRLLGTSLPGSASVAPSRTWSALPAIVAPFLLFAAVSLLYRADQHAVGLLRFLAYAGTGIAIFGIAQHVLFPLSLLFAEKRSYFSSLTAVFVNRNTAATFLGCTFLLLLALVGRRLGGRPALRTMVVMLIESGKARREWRLLLELVALGTVALALLLTKSRAGIASTGVSATLLALLLTAPLDRRRRGRRGRRLARRFAVSAGTIAAMGAALWLFGGQTLLRVVQIGFEDGRFCVLPGMWRAAADAWPVGTGAATFDLVFPAYRDPACGIYWTWDRAHNFYLEGAVTLGAVFVAVVAVVYGLLVPVYVRGILRRRRERFAPAAGLSVLVLVTLHDLLDFSLQIPGFAAWCAALLAACAVIATGRPQPIATKSGGP